jgi:hypothetical protein
VQELPRAIGMCAYLQILILKDNRISIARGESHLPSGVQELVVTKRVWCGDHTLQLFAHQTFTVNYSYFEEF